ncbi:MAG: hypothetical protein V6Z81_10245 [Parvularculales bacterium]
MQKSSMWIFGLYAKIQHVDFWLICKNLACGFLAYMQKFSMWIFGLYAKSSMWIVG